MNWFWNRKKQPLPYHRPKDRLITLPEWRKDPELRRQAKEWLAGGFGGMFMDMLHNGSPINFLLPDVGVRPEDRIHRLGQIEGYEACLRHIFLATIPPEVEAEPLQATYEEPKES